MAINVKDLYFKYPGEEKDTLKGISFNIKDGEWISIIGHNGSGKSTLAKIFMGIEVPEKGEVNEYGYPLTEDNLYEIRKHLGIIYQNPDNQFVATSVEDDIAFGLENLMVKREDMKEKIDNALKVVSMTSYREAEPSSLSGGQKQRVAIAGILAMNPECIIMDEATSMLDPKGRDELIAVIKELHKTGKTIIMITHNMNEALLADRTIVLSDGQIIKDDTSLNVLNDEKVLKDARLEMPSALALYHMLKNNGYMNEEVLKTLWELASKK